jgi:hypothetical protein
MTSSALLSALLIDRDTVIPFLHSLIVGSNNLFIGIIGFPNLSLALKYPSISPGIPIEYTPFVFK